MKTKSFPLTLFLLIGLGIIPFFTQAQLVERQLIHNVNTTPNPTYVSCAVDGNGNIYSATSYEESYTYEGQTITKLQQNSREEILFAVHDSAGNLLFYRRIAVTQGNFSTVGRIEFMAVDSLGYAYLSTQGTT
ncbi:MAG: hypothetical protein KDD63_20605, partial [Bacteroidetes bacterium]|nr:hypothetical protein [Bacteroidota bacterium]